MRNATHFNRGYAYRPSVRNKTHGC